MALLAGPMGQCFPLPDDDNLKDAMAKHAHNHEFIFNQYNFDVDTVPGSEMEKAERLWRRKKAVEARDAARKSQLERRRLQRLEKRKGPRQAQQSSAASPVRTHLGFTRCKGCKQSSSPAVNIFLPVPLPAC